ncbi:MAG: carbon storage regulator CsrA [Candidatus Schekmanbacteria bacterium]|nr:carbon storage regulator CsrA [Candidatus Schekmanbacteria bacterium]
MLVFTRKKEERIVIGNEIEIAILEISRDSVKIGIIAPRHISVHRHEVFDEIRRENVQAARSQVPDLSALQSLLGKLSAAVPPVAVPPSPQSPEATAEPPAQESSKPAGPATSTPSRGRRIRAGRGGRNPGE